MSKNNAIEFNKHKESRLRQEEIQTEVDSLYRELKRHFGAGYADSMLRRYTDVQPKLRKGE